jgi:hypothetical protein
MTAATKAPRRSEEAMPSLGNRENAFKFGISELFKKPLEPIER